MWHVVFLCIVKFRRYSLEMSDADQMEIGPGCPAFYLVKIFHWWYPLLDSQIEDLEIQQIFSTVISHLSTILYRFGPGLVCWPFLGQISGIWPFKNLFG